MGADGREHGVYTQGRGSDRSMRWGEDVYVVWNNAWLCD